ncbi:MAG: nuclear transport factor 2 family protein [Pseudomonadales bacterium]|nr:nuclear transport factor 2 family protein [Pseudomonadales bacterium]
MSNKEIVMSFINCWNTLDWDGAAALLTDDVVWDNVPMETMEGKAVVDAAMRGMAPDAVDWEVLAIAEDGDRVWTERIDKFDMPGGKRVELPVMGTFDIRDGKIAVWRDYFDLNSFTSQMA